MAKLRTICLLWASSSLLIGCSVTSRVKLMDAFTNCPPIFKPVIRTATYTAQIDFYKKHISGLFVFKAINDTTERVIFMNETGFKFFDFEFTPHNFKVQYIIPGLNKKIIVNTFSRDLGYLVTPPVENSAHLQVPIDTCTIFKFPVAKAYTYYTADKKCEHLQKIETGKDKKKNLIIDLGGNQNNQSQTINIAHQNFKLTIFMKQIKTDA